MKVLLVASEVVPFAKTGGLADVAGALPLELKKLGHDVRVAMPKYGTIDDSKFNLLPILGDIQVRLGDSIHVAEIKKTLFPDTGVPVYFVDNPGFFDREGLYQVAGVDYPDNAARFAFFSKAVIWLLKGLDWVPDIIHCNDWQTALIPVFLRNENEMKADPALSAVRVLYTIHNLAYQGVFGREEARAIGIGDNLFHPAALEFYGKLNLMKGGIAYADRISTVSERYAQEIQSTEFGCGLEGVLATRRQHLTGILNGIDQTAWDPHRDPHIPAKYSVENTAGKAQCKEALQKEVGLPSATDVPLVGIISRLDPQKGFDIIREVADHILSENLQLVLLGTGAPEYHEFFQRLQKKYPSKMSANLRFDNGLSHRIEAGSDIFLMPSYYEPCGLNQLYSLRYGTIPIVRKTGGLADSIHNATSQSIQSGNGTGFVFETYSATELLSTLRRALSVYQNKAEWKSLMRNAMSRDFSWSKSAKKYEELYEAMAGK